MRPFTLRIILPAVESATQLDDPTATREELSMTRAMWMKHSSAATAAIALVLAAPPGSAQQPLKLAASTGDNDEFTSSRVVASLVYPGGGCFNVRRHKCDASDRAGKCSEQHPWNGQ